MILVGSAVSAAVYLFATDAIVEALPEAPPKWGFYAFAAVAIFNILCVIALFNWKWVGFLGFCASAVAMIAINILIGMPILSAVWGPAAGVAILIGVLHIGDQRTKGWPQLE